MLRALTGIVLAALCVLAACRAADDWQMVSFGLAALFFMAIVFERREASAPVEEERPLQPWIRPDFDR